MITSRLQSLLTSALILCFAMASTNAIALIEGISTLQVCEMEMAAPTPEAIVASDCCGDHEAMAVAPESAETEICTIPDHSCCSSPSEGSLPYSKEKPVATYQPTRQHELGFHWTMTRCSVSEIGFGASDSRSGPVSADGHRHDSLPSAYLVHQVFLI